MHGHLHIHTYLSGPLATVYKPFFVVASLYSEELVYPGSSSFTSKLLVEVYTYSAGSRRLPTTRALDITIVTEFSGNAALSDQTALTAPLQMDAEFN